MRRLGVTTLIPALIPALALALALPTTASSAPAGHEDARAMLNPFDDGWTERVLDARPELPRPGGREQEGGLGHRREHRRPAGPGRVFRTTDRGETWTDVSPDTTDALSFRDVEVHDGVAHVLAIGPGEASRIYRSTDGGTTWTEAFRNADEKAFYDCMAFYGTGKRGLAVSDPVGGKLRILATQNRGRTWSVLPSKGMPRSKDEFGFAASGDCLVTTVAPPSW